MRRLAAAQLGHAAGDGMVAVALANTLFFAVPLGEARAKVALYLALTMAPFAVLSPVVGPWLDRWRHSHRWAVVSAGVGRAVLAGLLAGRTGQLALYPLAFGLLVLSRVHGVSRSALVPEVLPPSRPLIWGNAWLAVVSVAGGATGAGLSAAGNALAGPDFGLWMAVGVFSALAVPAFGLPGSTGADAKPALRDYRALLSPRLLAGGIAMATIRTAVGFATFLLAFLLRAGGHGPGALAVVVVAAGAAGFLGSVVAPFLYTILRESLLLLATVVVIGLAALWASTSFGLAPASILAAVVGLSSAAGRLAFDSLLQNDAPSEIRARTFARYETIFQLWWVAGAAMAAMVPFGPAAGLRTLAVLSGTGAALSLRGLSRRAGCRPSRGQQGAAGSPGTMDLGSGTGAAPP